MHSRSGAEYGGHNNLHLLTYLLTYLLTGVAVQRTMEIK